MIERTLTALLADIASSLQPVAEVHRTGSIELLERESPGLDSAAGFNRYTCRGMNVRYR